MWAANQPTAHGETTSARRFEADYAGRERLSDAGESGTIVPLFSSTASISSTAFDVPGCRTFVAA
jgi:hypothetical protein